MTILLFANQAQTILAAPVSNTATTLTVAPNTGLYFPQPSSGQAFKLTLTKLTNSSIVEIVLVTAVSGDTFTVVRAQEGTVARAWSAGDLAFNLATAGTQSSFVQIDGLENGTYSAQFQNMQADTGQIINSPVGPLDIANKSYVDTVAQGQKFKEPCVCATTANIIPFNLLIIDGYQTAIGDRVLLKNQDDPAENGIYIVATTGWTRSPDMDVWAEVPGASVIVLYGNTYASTGWVCTSPTDGTLDVTPITFLQTSGVGTYTAGTGLTLTGNVFSITNTAVTAGTYGSASTVPVIIVNAQGQITNAVSTNISIAPSQINAAIPNSKLQNSTITIGANTIALGGSISTLNNVTLNNSVFDASVNTLSNVANSSLVNSSITINGNLVSLGGSTTVTAVAPYPLTIGTGLDGTSYNGSSAVTIKLSDVGTAGVYGTASSVPVFTTNAQGRVTSVTNTPIAITNTQVSGLGTMSVQNFDNIAITGGTIQGTVFILDTINQTPIGDVTPDTGVFSTLRANSTVTLANYTGYVFAHDGSEISASATIPNTDITGLGTMSTQNATTVAITGGTIAGVTLTGGSINNTPIGSTTANTGKFTNLEATGAVKLDNYVGYVYANDGANITSSLTIPTTDLNGSITNAQLANSSVTYNGQTVALGGSGTITAVNPNALTIGTGLSGGSYDGSTAVTIANTGVLSFSAGTTGLTPATATNGNVTLGGTLNVAHGGTGATDAAGARSNLSAAVTGANNDITSLTALTGTISTPLAIQMANGAAVVSNPGLLWYNNVNGSWNAGMGGGNITQQIGEELFIYGKATSAITNGQVIWHTGSVGLDNTLTFAPVPLGNTNPSDIIGLATEDIASGQFGRITRFGIVHDLDTTGTPYGETWVEGDNLYYNPAYVGGLTNVAPSAPNQKTLIGQVITVDDTAGAIQVNLVYGSALGQTDSNVQFSGLANNDVLRYSTSLQYWTNVPQTSLVAGSVANALTIGTGLTGTSYNGSSPTTIAIDSTVVTLTGTQTLISKTISGANNTITNIGNSSLTNSSITIGSTNVALGGSVTTLVGTSISGSTNTLTNIPNSALINDLITIGVSPVPLGGSLSTLNGVTISGSVNTISNIGNSSLVNSAITIGSTSVALGDTITTLLGTSISGSTNTITNIGNSSLLNSSVTIGSDTVALGTTLSTLNGVSISGSANTLSNIGNSSLTNSSITIGNQNLALGSTTTNLTGLTYVTVTQDPTTNLQLATKQYVDSQIAAGFNTHTAAVIDTATPLTTTYNQGGFTNQLKAIASNVLEFQNAATFAVHDQIVFTNTYDGITAGTPYYVYSVIDSKHITISASYAGSQITGLTNGTGINNPSRRNSGVGATLTKTTNGALVVGTYTAVLNDRVLVIGQTNAYENGIYYVSQAGNGSTPYILTRATDGNMYIPNSTVGLNAGSYFLITNNGAAYVLNTTGNLIIGTTNLTFTQFAQTTAYTAGTGLNLSAYQFSIADTGVTAGTYGSASKSLSATVNAQGQLTSLSAQDISIAPSQINATIPNSGLTNSSITLGTDTVSLGATLTTLDGLTISGSANTITNIGNSSLTNSSVTIGSTSLSLGGTLTTLTGVTISGVTNTLSGIPNVALDNSSITIGSTGVSLGATISTLTGVTISGSANTLSNIGNASLTNSTITVNGSTISLGGSATVTATATNALTIGTGLNGTSYDGSSSVTISNAGVLSISGGTTGLTPATATAGAVTLGGVLNVANGGTGVATLTGLVLANGTSAFTAATASDVVSVIGTTPVTNATNASNATNATNASNVAVTEDTTTNTAIYPTLVDANTGNNAIKTTSTKLSFVPSTGEFSATSFTGAGTGLTGTANSLSIGGSAPAGSLTGSTLASGVTASSLTSVGTITSGTWSGSFGAVSGANLTNLTAGNLTGTIPSAVLGNSTLYIGSTAVALNRASGSQALTGITDITFRGSTSGNITIIPAAIAGSATVLTMPATTGTVITSGDTGTVTNTMLAGSIANNKLANSTISGISLGSNLATLTFGTYLTGTSYNGSTGVTIATNATSANTASTLVARDASGNFSAGTITATLSGSATSVSNALTIGTGLSGTSYNGSAAVTIANTGVLSFSGGTTGLTPTAATTGAITLAGTLAIANGGSGATTAQGAMNAFAGAVTSGYYLRGNGTNVVMSAIQAADVPTLNQNTTGTASNVTGVVAAANGGTGQSSYAVGDILYASTTTALSKLADVATGNALISGGVGVAPSYGKIGLTTHISGTLAIGNGGTGLTSFTANQIHYGSFSTSANFTYDGTNLNITSTNSTGTIGVTDTGTSGANIKLVGNGATTPNKTIRAFNGSFQVVNSAYGAAIFSLSDAGVISTSTWNGATVGVAYGGTGATTLTGVLKGNGTSAISAATAGTDYVAPGTATTFTATQTLNGSTSTAAMKITNITELASVTAVAPTATTNFYINTGAVQYITANNANNWTLNFAFSSGTTLAAATAVGDSISCTLMVTNGATAYYPTTFTIDGAAVTPKWQGGTAPSAGNASSIDVYNFVIIKTAATPTYTVLASQTQFK